ncbi:hypothetical protein EJ08DRAFT_699110 [Tothia fuscella]|uniref:Uncharacterized protein n=1 Tax=Tothia fuscella TaxID=1048955 RepID=A0A9P4NNC8_9PEZI|nr:hypothetical protein EJ08DRAFT_699110 [Tothia fuscella]
MNNNIERPDISRARFRTLPIPRQSVFGSLIDSSDQGTFSDHGGTMAQPLVISSDPLEPSQNDEVHAGSPMPKPAISDQLIDTQSQLSENSDQDDHQSSITSSSASLSHELEELTKEPQSGADELISDVESLTTDWNGNIKGWARVGPASAATTDSYLEDSYGFETKSLPPLDGDEDELEGEFL